MKPASQPANVPTIDMPSGAAEETARLAPEHRRLLALLLGSAFVVILNETTMALALKSIMESFEISASTGQWLTTIFLLTMAVVIPTTGWLLGRLGTRRAFLLAMSIFTLGTAIAAWAPIFSVLLVARAVQAIGTAIMMPLLMTTVMAIVPPQGRGRIMGNVALVIAAAPALGPTASGFILNHLSWHWIFIIMLPIAGVSLVAGSLWVRDFGERTRTRLDLISLPLAAVGFGGLVWGLSALSGSGPSPDAESTTESSAIVPPSEPLLQPWMFLLLGVGVLAVFVWRQITLTRDNRAFLDLRVLLVREFVVAIGLMCLAMFAMFGVLILLPLYLQGAMGLEPLEAGLFTLPGALIMGVMGPLVGRWYDRIGASKLTAPGLFLAAAALGLMTIGSETLGLLLAGHILMSIGMALVFTPMFTSALGSLTGPLVPHGSATMGTFQQVAGAAGTAAFVALLSARQTSALEGGASAVEALNAGAVVTLLVASIVMAIAGACALVWLRPGKNAGETVPA